MFFTSVVLAEGGNKFSHIDIKVNGQNLKVEYADSEVLRNLGLMNRKTLCAQCGMLFKLDQPFRIGMWMKNTYIPLDVAFIRSDGSIVNIESMKPLDLTITYAAEEVLYVLEMNQDWFQSNSIEVGDKVELEP